MTGSLTLNPWTLVILSQALVISGWFLAAPASARSWWQRNDIRILQINLAIGLIIWVTRLSTGTIT